jgi:hypothetical protein
MRTSSSNLFEEFVFGVLMAYGGNDEGYFVMRVRWFSFGSDDDTYHLSLTHRRFQLSA